jgi:hypothetical protein
MTGGICVGCRSTFEAALVRSQIHFGPAIGAVSLHRRLSATVKAMSSFRGEQTANYSRFVPISLHLAARPAFTFFPSSPCVMNSPHPTPSARHKTFTVSHDGARRSVSRRAISTRDNLLDSASACWVNSFSSRNRFSIWPKVASLLIAKYLENTPCLL